MKLSKYQREVIAKAIFADVPEPDNEQIIAALQAAIVEAMSPLAQDLYEISPDALARETLYDILYRRHAVTFIVGDADYKEVAAPWVAAKEKYDEAKRELNALVMSCETDKQFRERLPEFANYLPDEGAPTPQLPAVANLVARLVELGWKGGPAA